MMRILCLVAVLLLFTCSYTLAQCDSVDLALGRPATTSSLEGPSFPASNAFDGDTTTRWSSAFSDPQFIYVDLGATINLCEVTLFWESALGTNFTIDLSNDGTVWTTVATITGNSALKDSIPISGSGRYVRMNGTARGTPFGYSLLEFRVFGFPTSCNTTNIALGRPVTVSSTQGGLAAANAVDGDKATRWGSDATDPQFIYVDLGGVRSICQVSLYWEAAFASSYNIDVSDDALSWTTIASVNSNTATTNILNVAGSGRYVRMMGLTRATGFGYSLFEFEVRDQSILPILLSKFEAVKLGDNYASIRWTTETEVNNQYFTIERSFDGLNYEAIGRLNGAGNSLTEHDYQWTDSLPGRGMNYYRLRQVDLDGKYTYSKVAALSFGASAAAGISVYPNPARDFAHVVAGAGLLIHSIRIYNAAGMEIRKYDGLSLSIKDISMYGFSSGVYSLKILTDKGVQIVKLIK